MIQKSKEFNVEYKANFVSRANNDIKIWVAKPTDSEFQKIKKFSISPVPQKMYRDNQKNKILHFDFKNQRKLEIKINISVILKQSQIKLNKNYIKISKNIFRRYKKNERFLEQTTEIKKLTRKIIKNSSNDLDKIKSIFIFIAKNFNYCYPVKKRGVKNLNLNKLSGDCGEYSSLFVTMCRVSGIPARNNTGFVIFPKHEKISEHGWASIYLKPYGWVDMDPQYASLEKNIKTGIKKYFGRRTDYRITFINGFNIPLKLGVPKNFQFIYWKNLGLPIANNSAQILQPLVFASKNEVKFKDNIKLIP
ncbi:MAG: transglutaminase-like domain-containing protein [bacterium]